MTDANAFRGVRHAEPGSSGAGEDWGDKLGRMAVGVGLDDGKDGDAGVRADRPGGGHDN